MKVAVVIVAIALVFPLGWLASRRRWMRDLLVVAIGALVFTDYFDINPISYEDYRGVDRGLELTIVDLAVWTLGVSLPRSRHPVPYRTVLTLYLIPAVLSVFLSAAPLLGVFSLWTLLRTYLLVAVLARAFQDATVPPLLLKGLAGGLVYQAGYALSLRYLEHHHQVAGTFSHQNTLGMAVNLVLPIMAALALRERNRLAAVGVLAGALCIVLTLSRAALAMMAVGLGLVYLASIARRVSRRKLWAAAAAVVAGVVLAIKSMDTIVRRFLYAPEASASARDQFNQAAALMLEDHPFGVGLNLFSRALEGGYAEQVGITGYSTSSVVHNVYWLTLAEVGYVGLAAYLLLIGAPLLIAIRGARRARADVRGDVMLGCAVGLSVFYAQGMLEWAARQTVLMYMFGMIAALSVALWRQVREEAVTAQAPLRATVTTPPRRPVRPAFGPAPAGYAARWGLRRRHRA